MVALNEAWPAAGERTLGGILAKQAKERPDQVCLLFKDRSWTYSALDAWVDRLAAGLLAFGAEKGDKVALMLPNDPVFVALMFGCGRAGVVEVPINVAYKGHLLKHLLTNSGARIAVMAAEFLDRLADIAADLPDLATVIVWPGLDGSEPELPFQTVSFDELDIARGPCPDQGVCPEDPLGIMYTSARPVRRRERCSATTICGGTATGHERFAMSRTRTCSIRACRCSMRTPRA